MWGVQRGLCALLLVAGLAGCADKTPQATDVDMARYSYVSNDPPSLTLVTSISNRSNAGAHSALIINGPERVVFNPAGSWRHPLAPEQGDFHRNFSPAMEKWFFDYHARETFRIRAQTIEVPMAVAAQALAEARAYGSVPPAQCTRSITTILANLPGFEEFATSWFPLKASAEFAELPGVTTVLYTDDSPDDWSDLNLEFND
ncbi:hypothetical protein [Meridianimarinicoccus aquatilis]|uniref:Lipoprotein n=1 Tax=Meridianimarinicoccus aquatilis TaxID=2552766 RepID=A0A4R6AYX7_9RHOB|nr:hypothetical protein [Fluviibacterium aquatile]QIE41752.1 hypothetical protein G5B39_07160 [Rhodobacteraceae bacterium SC52]TDL88078.1 hypothetical protein E2L05_09255 [Fluviibacterium aquatile]